mmetsp:Transcript_37559/g.86753  ORF Transcript_37559/g.86753 Transcript_37559/m.86753 type:complete len:547 (-) Transcript_37559:59-1699(-)
MAVEEVVLIVSATLAVGLGWAIGANDAANALGAAFGAGILSVRRGVQIAAVAEFVGAATLGSQVAATLATKVLSQCQINAELEGCEAGEGSGPFTLATHLEGNDRWATVNCASLCGAALFLVLASTFGLPASSTHSTIAALVGSGLIATADLWSARPVRWNTVEWEQVWHIVEAWVISPCLGCCIAFLIHCWVRFSAYRDAAESADGIGYWLGPLASSSVALVCTALFAELLHQRDFVGWAVVPVAATSVALLVHIAVALCLAITPDLWVRWNRSLHGWSAGQVEDGLMSRGLKDSEPPCEEQGRRPSVLGKEAIELEIKGIEVSQEAEPDAHTVAKGDCETSGAADELWEAGVLSDADAILIAPILSLAALMCVAHGSNDVANALGPLVAVLSAYGHASADGGSWWPSALVGAGILGGVAVQGYRVMQTVGNGIARLNVKSSFSCQLSTVSTVLIASWLGLPVSTTHVLIGALCGVAGADTVARSIATKSLEKAPEESTGDGGMRAGGKRTLLKIVTCWVLTLPLAASIAASAFLVSGSMLAHIV